MTSTSLRGMRGKYSNYHYCIVRECKNIIRSIKSPEKLWIRVSREINMRNAWLKLAEKDADSYLPETIIHFCEDHFDLENDMENYMQYKIMSSVKKIQMKANCLPSRFDCQTERKRKLTPSPHDQLHDFKKIAVTPVSEDITHNYSMELSNTSFHQELCSKKGVEKSCHTSTEKIICCKAQKHVMCQVKQDHAHKVVQAHVAKHYRSKQVQFGAKVINALSSPIKVITLKSTSTSPIKPSLAGQTSSRRKLLFKEENTDSDTSSYKLSQEGSSCYSPPSTPSSQTTEDSLQENYVKDQKINLQSTLDKINNNPRLLLSYGT